MIQIDAAALAALLDDLTPLGGVAGHERTVAAHMARVLHASGADDTTYDALGNLIARFGPPDAPHKVAILAHMDTVGLLVKQIDAAAGILRVVPVGGVNVKALPGAAVQVWQYGVQDNMPALPGIPGVIGVRSQHLARPGDTATDAADLYVQVDPAAAAQLCPTAPVTFAPQIVRQGDRLYSSPHLDNRAGCAVLLAVGQWLSQSPQITENRTVYLIGTVQEETTCAGALHALRIAAPDRAIFVDGTVSYDTPDTQGLGAVHLGGGPVLTAFLYTSGLNGWHADPLMRGHLRQHARANGIPFQEDAVRGLMSDARTAAWLGIPSALVGIPMRGKHAPLETAHLDDLVHTAELIALELADPYLTE